MNTQQLYKQLQTELLNELLECNFTTIHYDEYHHIVKVLDTFIFGFWIGNGPKHFRQDTDCTDHKDSILLVNPDEELPEELWYALDGHRRYEED